MAAKLPTREASAHRVLVLNATATAGRDDNSRRDHCRCRFGVSRISSEGTAAGAQIGQLWML
jgi:hypothetical protein